MTRLLAPTLLALGALSAAPVLAADVAAGEEMYQDVCRNCHGPTAKGLSSYPRLAGQSAEELTDKLERYRAGERIGPNAPLMNPPAQDSTDDEIAGIATNIATNFE